MKKVINYLGKLSDIIASRVWITVPVVAFTGFYVSYVYEIEMNKDVWFWFFSSIAQAFAALIALVAIFLISRLEFYNAAMNSNIQMMRYLIPEFRKDVKPDYLTVDELVIRITDNIIDTLHSEKANIIPRNGFYLIKARADFNELKQKKKQALNYMMVSLKFTIPIIMLSIFLIPLGSPIIKKDIWLWNPLLEWGFIYSVVGLCFSSLYKIGFALGQFLYDT